VAKDDFVFDYVGTKKLYDFYEGFADKYDSFLGKLLLSAGQRALEYTIENTPVGVYPEDSGMMGGSLRRAWKLTPVVKTGNEFSIILYADDAVAHYALYVEEGHRTVAGYVFQLPDGTWRRTKNGRVEGQHMSRDAVETVRTGIPSVYGKTFLSFIRRLEAEHLGG